MDTKQKYIRLKQYGAIIIFPMHIEHKDFKHMNIESAGFCYVNNNKVSCFGESTSLKLKSNPEADSLKATQQLFGYE